MEAPAPLKATMEKEGPLLPKGSSRLPVPCLRPKRPAPNENEPPQPLQKRARGDPSAAKRGAMTIATSQCRALAMVAAAPAAHRNLRRGLVSTRQAVPVGPPKPASTSSATTGKRAPWDLKGQVSDLRSKVGTYKEKLQGLAGENEALRLQVAELQAGLGQAKAQAEELSGQASTLASELQVSQEQAKENSQKVSELLVKEQELEETLRSQASAISHLESAGQEAKEANGLLAAQLETREAELLRTEVDLAEQRAQREALEVRVAELEQKLHESEMERRHLHNAVQELKGNIRVFCRVRPLLPCEKEAQKGMAHLHFPPEDRKSLVLSKAEESHVGRERKEDITYEFNFDRVFPPSSSQAEVFEEIALLVQSALDGYHVCIFAYGQTGSGKTYTMEGPDKMEPDTVGMIPRAVRQIFQTAREMEAKGWKYQFMANFLEIYNESLRDLLVLRPEQSPELEIRRVSPHTEELHVPNLSYVPVASEQEVLRLLQRAKAHRSVARTSLNERSSRSHSLFQLHIEGQNVPRELHTTSVLSLVDLAGSERLDKSLSKGERLKETQAINSSLSNLGLVIMALSNKEAHIPYRNSKLTYLLQNSLGGSSKMLMFVNISPLEENFGESLSSLRFARKVNECVIGTASANRK
ncbi:kinesin-like protein KIFC1 isoform X2 [Sceloporus undulatus]|uniref:kinesin-like protein KIFC1 isoform X2 n=1 Tax=Sceloporus undulatus TaxID=8520 RepID=UPI001C4C10A9|nr:kinesin-like protein KIFC1 isoform X2 [Sceloporus undulatus]